MNWNNFRLTTRLNKFSSELIEEIYMILAEIDGVKNSWQLTGKLLPQTIERLTHAVIITSSGSSNRIEGNRLTDEQVNDLYRNMRIKKFRTRDEQEVVGYLETLALVFNNYAEILIKESSILYLHRNMLKYSDKDARHKGQYKFGSNRVEAKDQSGNIIGVIFDPTPPHLVPKEMHELLDWYAWAKLESNKHPLILAANFLFEYLAIHPFQDGNGRTSRLLTNLILLQEGYHFTAVVSHERLVELNKADYYLALNRTQASWKTDLEDIAPFLLFFLKIVRLQAQEAIKFLEQDNFEYLLSEKQLALWQWACSLSPKLFSRADAIAALGFPARTVEACIKKLFYLNKLERIGQGRATRYKVFTTNSQLTKAVPKNRDAT